MITIDTQNRRLVQRITNYNMGLLRLQNFEKEYLSKLEKLNSTNEQLSKKKTERKEADTKLAQRKLQIESCERIISEAKREKSRLDFTNFNARAEVDKRLSSAYEVYYNYASEYFKLESQLKSLDYDIHTLTVEQNIMHGKVAEYEKFLIMVTGGLVHDLYAIEIETGKILGSENLQKSINRNNRGGATYQKLTGVETITFCAESEKE